MEILTLDILGLDILGLDFLGHFLSELRQPDNHQPSQSSIHTAQVILQYWSTGSANQESWVQFPVTANSKTC